tara:strand:+ start:6783 stop:7079 length:297 start_codon:yes stop_codon:yes gene_type:complete
MKYIKRMNEIFAFGSESFERAIQMVRKLVHGDTNFNIGDDHLGNTHVLLFTINDIEFEVYDIEGDGDFYNVSFKKDTEDWNGFKTGDLGASLNEIINH